MDLFERRQVGALASVISSAPEDAQYLVSSGRLQVPKPSLEVAKRLIENNQGLHHVYINDAVNQVIETNEFERQKVIEVGEIFNEEAID